MSKDSLTGPFGALSSHQQALRGHGDAMAGQLGPDRICGPCRRGDHHRHTAEWLDRGGRNWQCRCPETTNHGKRRPREEEAQEGSPIGGAEEGGEGSGRGSADDVVFYGALYADHPHEVYSDYHDCRPYIWYDRRAIAWLRPCQQTMNNPEWWGHAVWVLGVGLTETTTRDPMPFTLRGLTSTNRRNV